PYAVGEDQVVIRDTDPLHAPLALRVEDDLARLAERPGEELAEPARVDRARDPHARLGASAVLQLERDEQLGLADDALAREDDAHAADHERAGRAGSPASRDPVRKAGERAAAERALVGVPAAVAAQARGLAARPLD